MTEASASANRGLLDALDERLGFMGGFIIGAGIVNLVYGILAFSGLV